MAWTLNNSVAVGGATKKSDYDKLWDNCDFQKIEHNTDGTHKNAAGLINVIYPVGTIYTSIIATNPGTVFGFGTWVAFGAGKVLVGIDGTQAEFDTVEETGGTKTHTLITAELASHLHTVDPPSTTSGNMSADHIHGFTTGTNSVTHNHGYLYGGYVLSYGSGSQGGYAFEPTNTGSGNESTTHTHSGDTGGVSANHSHAVDIASFNSGSEGSGTAHNNLQPYIVVYFFKRTV